jgi:hypothetical protein
VGKLEAVVGGGGLVWLRNCRADMEELKSSRRRGAGGEAEGRWLGGVLQFSSALSWEKPLSEIQFSREFKPTDVLFTTV